MVAEGVFPVTTDSVLLGAWCSCANAKRTLDVGTGSGLLSLMIAQQSKPQNILAIDTHRNSVRCAEENFFNSPWKDRLSVCQLDLNEMYLQCQNVEWFGTFDLVVCNPPYYSGQFLPVNSDKKRSKHAEIFDFYSLFDCAYHILNKEGRISIVIPVERESQISLIALRSKFYLVKSLLIKHYEESGFSLILLEYSKSCYPLEKESLTLYTASGKKTSGYQKLTDSFYL